MTPRGSSVKRAPPALALFTSMPRATSFTQRRAVAVVSADATTADALSTALFILGPIGLKIVEGIVPDIVTMAKGLTSSASPSATSPSPRVWGP